MPSRVSPQARYRPRDPRASPFYRLVQDHVEDFELSLRTDQRRSSPDPRAADAFRAFLECGILRFGAARYQCPSCGQDLFVAFSCKRRGLCPSCDAKRAAYTAAHAMDYLLPPVAYRQWVLTSPKRLRWCLDQRPELVGEVSRILAQEIDAFLSSRAPAGQSAQIHFVQRFGAALNLHQHLHVVAADGVFVEARDRWGRRTARFIRVPPPTGEELQRIIERVRRKVLRRFVRLGAISREVADQLRSWENSGFGMHAQTSVQAHDREGLGRLLRYCARPAMSLKRLRYKPEDGLALYETERQDGKTRVLELEPVEFLRRVALLKPPPRKNLVRYYGALAPNAPMRPLIADIAERCARKKLARGMKTFEKLGAKIAGAASKAWAALISRIYEVDPLLCPNCGARMELMAVILEVDEVTRLLDYFELPTGFPKTLPARSPPESETDESPDEESQLDPRVDLYEGIDPLPADN